MTEYINQLACIVISCWCLTYNEIKLYQYLHQLLCFDINIYKHICENLVQNTALISFHFYLYVYLYV